MKTKEARKILGLGPKDNPRDHMGDFQKNLRSKKDLIEQASDDEEKLELKKELHSYATAIDTLTNAKKSNPIVLFVVFALLIAAVSASAWWVYDWYHRQWQIEEANNQRLELLTSLGENSISKRRWDKAEEAYKEMLTIDPESSVAKKGLADIEQAKVEERNQQIVFTLGQSQAALEAGRWEEAKGHAMSVLKSDPNNEEAKSKLAAIAESKHKQVVAEQINVIEKTIDKGELTKARQEVTQLRKLDPKNTNILRFSKYIDEALEEIRRKQSKANKLLLAAQALDNGEFSSEALAILAEAKKLDPDNIRITQLHRKMSSYTRSLNVPADYPTISKALEAARPRDIIHIAAGTYKEALEIHQTVRLQGTGDGKTIIQLPASESGLITVHPQSKGTLISGFKLVHDGFNHSKERYAGITIMAQDVHITGCSVTHAGGHGIAVVDGGKTTISGCEINDCGWDGIAIYGEGSHASIRNTKSNSNIQHGIGAWGGGSVVVGSSEMSKNGFCGIYVTGSTAQASISGTRCSYNREAGILVADGTKAIITANRCDKNLLSGIVARSKGTKADITNNATMGNQEAGIITYADVELGKFEKNQALQNTRKQIIQNVTEKK